MSDPSIKHTFYRPHPRVKTDVGDTSMTLQAHKAECDIHNILSNYQKTGTLTHFNDQKPTYTDLPDQHDYQHSLHLLKDAQNAFDALPSAVRDKFHNDPAEFLGAFNDPSMSDFMREHGLIEPLPAAPAAAPPPSPAPDPKTPS